MEELNRRGIRSKVRVAKNGRKSGGKTFSQGALYELLSNPIVFSSQAAILPGGTRMAKA
jgi:hypothetical protein